MHGLCSKLIFCSLVKCAVYLTECSLRPWFCDANNGQLLSAAVLALSVSWQVYLAKKDECYSLSFWKGFPFLQMHYSWPSFWHFFHIEWGLVSITLHIFTYTHTPNNLRLWLSRALGDCHVINVQLKEAIQYLIWKKLEEIVIKRLTLAWSWAGHLRVKRIFYNSPFKTKIIVGYLILL